MNPPLAWTDHFELSFECGLALLRRPHPDAEGCPALALSMHGQPLVRQPARAERILPLLPSISFDEHWT